MKQFALNPFSTQQFMNDLIFDSPYGVLRDILLQRGIEIHTYDNTDLASADRVLCFNHDEEFFQHCRKLGIAKDRLALFVFEPAVVLPQQHKAKTWERYGQCFSVRDDLVNNRDFHKLRFPQGQKKMLTLPSYGERKFITLINANKYSYVKNELYSLRRKAIRYFDQHDGFDLFGYGWDERNRVFALENIARVVRSGRFDLWLADIVDSRQRYRSNRGKVDDKYRVLAKYKFCLCFENERDVPGYITEKIFDCFFTGSVPIYLGASNMATYIPKDCYIDFTDFSGFTELEKYLQQLSQKDWEGYFKAAQRYIGSAQFTLWRPKAIFQSVIDQLLLANKNEVS